MDSSTRSQHSAGTPHAADEMSAIRQTEKGRRLPVDGLLNIFMKGCAAENREEHLMTEFMLRQLGLEPCEDTLVGNDWFRGVSGGQRKRVSAGALCRRAACRRRESALRTPATLCKAALPYRARPGAHIPMQHIAHATFIRMPPSCLAQRQAKCRRYGDTDEVVLGARGDSGGPEEAVPPGRAHNRAGLLHSAPPCQQHP